MKNILVLIGLSLSFTGCVTVTNPQRMNDLTVNMSKKEVLSVMGKPSSTAAPNSRVELLRYKMAGKTDWYAEEYFIRLVDGKVESYGKMGDFDSTKDPTLNINIDSN